MQGTRVPCICVRFSSALAPYGVTVTLPYVLLVPVEW